MKPLASMATAMLLTICGLAPSQDGAGAGTDAPGPHDSVLALQPVGYWPADEGHGEVLHDRSSNGNHGRLINTPWRDGLLDFSNDVYQWAQIPHHPTYASRAFTVGGWVFSRRTYRTSRVLLIGQPWVSREPGSIESFSFAGRGDDPRRVACGWMNYMNFARKESGAAIATRRHRS